MNDEDFQKLLLSVKQMGTIMRGGKLAHRRTTLTDLNVKGLRERTGLTQADFSQMIGVSIRTLQNWEQGRREPEGPAKALLRVVERNGSTPADRLTFCGGSLWRAGRATEGSCPDWAVRFAVAMHEARAHLLADGTGSARPGGEP